MCYYGESRYCKWKFVFWAADVVENDFRNMIAQNISAIMLKFKNVYDPLVISFVWNLIIFFLSTWWYLQYK